MPGGRTGENSDHGIEPQSVKGYTLELTEDLDSDPGKLKVYASDLNTLEARMIGRSHDLDGAHNDAAQSFTELFKWPIIEEKEIDLENWAETTRAIYLCSALTTELAEEIKHYKDERARIISRWNTEAPNVPEIDIPNPMDDIGYQNPLDDLPTAPTENTGNEALLELKEELEEEERTLKATSVEVIDEITDNIRNGESPEMLTRLHEGGYINYGYFNHGGELQEGIPFDVDHEELPENMMEYVDGDKEPDDEFYEMVAYLSNIGFKGLGAQNFDDVNMDPEDMQLLKDLFDHIEEEGDLMGIPEDVQGNMSPEDSAALLGALGSGLLVLSDQRLKSGDSSTEGGYYALPESFREAAEYEFQGRSDEDPWSNLHEFFQHVPEGLSPGRGLSLTLNMSIADYLDTATEEGDYSSHQGNLYLHGGAFHDEDIEQQILDILDVSFRNQHANADMFNGDGIGGEDDLEDWFVNPHGAGDLEQEREDVLTILFTHDWEDDGKVVGELTNWMHENAPGDPDDLENRGNFYVTSEERLSAHAMEGFMRLMNDHEFYESLSGTGLEVEDPDDPESVWRNVSSAQLNPELAHAWSELFLGYRDSFAGPRGLGGGEGDPDAGQDSDAWGWSDADQRLYMSPTSRLKFTQLFMGDEEAALNAYSDILEYEMNSMGEYIGQGPGDRDSLDVQRSGTLRGLLDEALSRESDNRQEKHDEQLDYENKVQNDAVDILGGAAGDVGVPGTFVEIFKSLAKGDPESEENESVMNSMDVDGLMTELQLKLVLLNEVVEVIEDDEEKMEELEETRGYIFDNDGNFLRNPYEWDVSIDAISPRLSDVFDDIAKEELNGRTPASIDENYLEDWGMHHDAWSGI